MKKSDYLTKLFSAINERNWEDAVSFAEAICAHEETAGRTNVSRLLKSSLHAKSNGKNGRTNGSHAGLMLASALKSIRSQTKIADIFLRKGTLTAIQGFLNEWRHKDRLLKKKIPVRSKLLFHGPPGCGKSLSAAAIGNELGLPTYMVRFDAVIGSYLGQTAINLRQIFQFAESNPCVILFDELDALGKKRGNPLDVGELDRIVISLMQELEHSRPAGIIIATSNLPKLLDDALWRRFDLAIEYPRPNKSELLAFGREKAKYYGIKIPSGTKTKIENSKSFANAEQLVLQAARAFALKETG